MKIKCIINGIERNYDVDPTMRLRDFLVSKGHFAVRDSDDAEGFCGSDTILVDGVPVIHPLETLIINQLEGGFHDSHLGFQRVDQHKRKGEEVDNQNNHRDGDFDCLAQFFVAARGA